MALPLFCPDCVNSLDYPVRHGYGGKGATFENSASRKTVELYAPLEISRGAKSNALVHSQRHRICRHGFIMNLAVRAGKYPTVFLIVQPPAHKKLPR